MGCVMKRYPKYKDSGVEWIAKIPEHWSAKPLCRVVSCNDDALADDTRADTNLRYVDISSVDYTAGIKQVTDVRFGDAPSRARRKAKVGDVVISTVRTYLKAVAPVTPEHADCTYSTGFAVLRPRPHQVEPGFLKWMMLNELLVQTVEAHSEGLSYPAINATELVKLKALIPPPAEQRAITAALNRETVRIDALIEKKTRFVELLREKRRAIITHTVTKGSDPTVKMRDSGVAWIGQIPEHWKIRPIKSLAKLPGSLFVDGNWIESKNLSDEGIRYITTGNVGDGVYKEQGSGFISEATFRELGCTEVLPGDVLVSRLNPPIGRACIVPSIGYRVVTSVDNVILRPDSDFEPRFLVYRFSSADYYHELSVMGSGATMQRVGRRELGNISVAWPPLKEQRAIAAYLDRQMTRIDDLISKTELSIVLLKERRAAFITAAVTGQIDLRQEAA